MTVGLRLARESLGLLPESPPAPSIDELRRELGLERVLSLGLNEGPDGPFPSALRAIAAATPSLNRYPGRGSRELGRALAARHGVSEGQVFVAAGADAVIGYVAQAVLEPGDEIVTAWPSFPSFARDAQKRDAVPVAVPLVDGHADLDAMVAAVGPRTRLVFLATPNNPTGLVVSRDDALAFVAALPDHVLPVLDEAYFDYVDPADRLDGIADVVRAGRPALVLRTFSKLYGLAGLRVGYGVGPEPLVAAMRKVQRGYDVGSLAQVAALASVGPGNEAEVERRQARNREAVAALDRVLSDAGLATLGPSAANFVLADVGERADALVTALLRQGVVVQPGEPFGAPTAVRVTAGTPDELALLAERLPVALAARARA